MLHECRRAGSDVTTTTYFQYFSSGWSLYSFYSEYVNSNGTLKKYFKYDVILQVLTSPMAVSVGSSSPPRGGATKRPLSSSPAHAAEPRPAIRRPGSLFHELQDGGGKNARSSPETKARRPLQRPSSISFTQPVRTMRPEGAQGPAKIARQEVAVIAPRPLIAKSVSYHSSFSHPTSPDMDVTSRVTAEVALPPPPPPTSAAPKTVLSSKEQPPRASTSREGATSGGSQAVATRSWSFDIGARKSRSLEDIMNSPEEESPSCGDCGIGGLIGRRRGGAQTSSKTFVDTSYSSPLDRSHCQSNSSISSSGSHNSLHGSLEMVQVS